ncbi:MAG: lipopolysaccharide transport periplasmic protein LptA [Succinivibrio sp.]|nr:lipopolysaccharide transport periplasmic protein LptA [Succinivibrio sp.]
MSLTIRKTIKLTVLVLTLASTPAMALKSDTEQPLHIESDEQLADLQANKAIFTGKVHAVQGTIELNADKTEVIRDDKGQLKEVHAYGNPVTYRQKQDNGKIIRSQSSVLDYYPQRDLVVLTGKATIWQDESHVNGEKIEYNLNTQKMKASNANAQGGRVQSTFIPQEFKKTSDNK